MATGLTSEHVALLEQERDVLQARLGEVALSPAERRQGAKRLQMIERMLDINSRLVAIDRELAELAPLLSDADMRDEAEREQQSLTDERTRLAQELIDLQLPHDPTDDRNAIVEIRPGVGGDEAALFAGNLLRMYLRFAERQGWKTEMLSHSQTELGGTREAIVRIIGEEVHGILKWESGVHRIQRVPETEKAGRVHTSTATIAVLPEAEEVDLTINPQELRIDVFRAGGHGGQGVNTTDSAVRITHLPTGLVVSMQDERSQQKNKEKGMQILRARLYAQEQERIAKERVAARSAQIGTGDRSEKIRTYNVPQDRVTDHRIKMNVSNVAAVMDGDLTELLIALKQEERAKLLALSQAGA